MNFTNNLEEAEKTEKLRNKILKYIVYKKRTEEEIRAKFSSEDNDMVEDAIQYFKELNYINDFDYIDRSVKEFIALKRMSIKEIKYKICQKGVSKDLVDEYIYNNEDILSKFERSSAKAIVMKKIGNMEENEIRNFLIKKGYKQESINAAFEENC